MGELALVPEDEIHSNFPDSAVRLLKLIRGKYQLFYLFFKVWHYLVLS